MKHKIQTAFAFSFDDWVTLVQAWFLLLGFDLGLRALPFPRVQQFAAQVRNRRTNSDDTALVIRRLERVIDVASRYHLYPMTCLRQALALQLMLGQCGIASDLRIGVRKEDGALQAHAWVECGGILSSQSIRAEFVPLLADHSLDEQRIFV